MEVNSQFDASAALPGTHWTEAWVGLRASGYGGKEKKKSLHCQNQTPVV
jgi:hypothetical protein